MSRPPRLAWAAWIAVCLIWGTTYLGIRIALETIPPATMTAARWVTAGLIVLGIARARGARVPGPSAWPGLALLGALMIGCGNGLVVYAEQWVPSGLTAVILATSPFWMVGVEAMLPRGETLARGALIGLVIGFSGIVLLVWPDLRAGGTGAARFALGLVALQLACAGWAAGSAYSKRQRHGNDVLGATAIQMLFGGLLMGAVAALSGEWPLPTISGRSLGALSYLVLVGSVGGFVAYIYALRFLSVSTVSLYAYVNPVIAVVLGALVLGEPFTLRVVVAAATVLAGLAVVRSIGAGARPAFLAVLRSGNADRELKRVTS